MTRVLVQWCVVVFFLAVLDVQAHDVTAPLRDPLSHAPKQPAAGAPDESVSGLAHRLVIDDRSDPFTCGFVVWRRIAAAQNWDGTMMACM